MTEDRQEVAVLIPESLEIFRSKLSNNGKPYTDEQLNRAAVFSVSPVLSLGAALGAADDSPVSMFTTANLMARTVLADFINSGCFSVQAVDRYMDKAEALAIEEQKKAQEKADREDTESGEDSSQDS